jgi:hypothetical protein
VTRITLTSKNCFAIPLALTGSAAGPSLAAATMTPLRQPLTQTYCLNPIKDMADKQPVRLTICLSGVTMRGATLMKDTTTKKTTDIDEESKNTAIVSAVLVVAILVLVIALVIGHRI